METAFSIQAPLVHGRAEAQATVCKVLERIQTSLNFSNVEMARWLHVKPNTYGNWLKNGRVPMGIPPWSADTEAVIMVMAIHRSLSAMFQNPQDQLLWLKTPHPDFQKTSPLDHAIGSCAGLFYLKGYLDYVRGRGA